MFEELNNKQTPPSVGQIPAAPRPPAPAEDIFAEVDKADKPEAFRPRPGATPPRGTVLPPETGWKSNKLMVFGLLFGGLAIIAAGGYFGLKLALKGKQATNNQTAIEQPAANQTEPETNGQTNIEPVQPEVPPEIPPEPTAPSDTDADGLTDEIEAGLGTNPTQADTDADGLTDREEAIVYKTDPLKADTDNDGYKDGDEVRSGYNPLGSGKLLEIK